MLRTSYQDLVIESYVIVKTSYKILLELLVSAERAFGCFVSPKRRSQPVQGISWLTHLKHRKQGFKELHVNTETRELLEFKVSHQATFFRLGLVRLG